jgi:hypothetical protein
MNRHASDDELADLGAGILRPRRAARIEQHLTGCPQCRGVSSQLASMPQLLSSVGFPAMPADLSARIDTALASEVRQRQASAPATEAGRRDLPVGAGGGGPRGNRGGWRLPGFSVGATRVLAAAGALVIIGGVSYGIAANVGPSSESGSSSSGISSNGPAALPESGAAGQSVGPRVSYGHSPSARSIQVVTSDTNFVPATLADQATDAVRAARLKGVHSVPVQHAATGPSASSSAAAGNFSTRAGLSDSQLEGCLDKVAPGRSVLLVEVAKFKGSDATIVVTAASGSHDAEAWVVGPACSASSRDVLDHVTLKHL